MSYTPRPQTNKNLNSTCFAALPDQHDLKRIEPGDVTPEQLYDAPSCSADNDNRRRRFIKARAIAR